MKKIFFFDIDGTLLPYGRNDILLSTKYAIEQLKNNGHEVYIATGKCYAYAKDIGQELGIENFLTTNGQIIYKNNKIVAEEYFTKEDLVYLSNLVKDHDVTFGVQGNDEKYLVGSKNLKNAKLFFESISVELPEVKETLDFDVKVGQTWLIGDFSKVEVPERFMLVNWPDYGTDVVLKHASKGNAISRHFNLDEIETYGFGDGHNDIDMFKVVNNAVAMGNSDELVKSHANHVTDDDINHGIYNYLVKNNLIKEHDDEASIF